MVKIMENPMKMDDLGDHHFWKHPTDFHNNIWNGYVSPENVPNLYPLGFFDGP